MSKVLVGIGLAAVLLAAGPAGATMLTFENPDGFAAWGPWNYTADQAYGDNVTAAVMGNFAYDVSDGTTPDVTVDYLGYMEDGTPNAACFGVDYGGAGHYGGMLVVGETNFQTYTLDIVLTCTDPGKVVSLKGFDAGTWMHADPYQVQVLGGDRAYDSGVVTIMNDAVTHFDFTQAGQGIKGSTLTLRLLLDGSDQNGVKNVDFVEENIPEPATLGLLAVGGVAALLRRRRA